MTDNSVISDNSVACYATELLSALGNETGGLHRIIGIGYKILGNPILVTDKSWKAIDMTDEVVIPDDRDWNAFLKSGMLPTDVVAAGIKVNLADRIEQSDEPFEWQSDDMSYPRLFCTVSINNKSVATLTVIGFHRPFNKNDYFCMKILSSAIAAEMQKDQFRQYTRGLMYEDFLWNLLDGRLTDPRVVEERVRILNLGIKKNIYVFVFDLSEYDSKQFSLTYMRDVLEKMISGGQALIYNNNIVITTSYARARDIFQTELTNLSDFLKEYNIRCGISRRCVQPSELRFYYEQAQDAMRIGTHLDPERYIYPYGEYAVYHIAQVCNDNGGTKRFCHPALEVLIRYDEEYSTNFTESLYTYIRQFKNITNTANALHLHRNTLVYHLKRIEEIMDVSLSDANVIQLFDLSFRLLEYDKQIERKEKWNDVPEREQ